MTKNTGKYALDLSAVPPPDISPIIENLKGQANVVLKSALGTLPLVSFQTGGAGNFPYYYTDPAFLTFNYGTYNWINTNLLSNVPPIQQSTGSNFTNLFLSAISKITYQLSTTDQALLNTAMSAAITYQMALLTAWKSEYGSFPAGSSPLPIDNIMSTICATWATPPTNLNAIQSSTNLHFLLNNAPASGQTIMSAVAQYINALGASVSLANAVTMNNAYVAQALVALQSPAASNGGMITNNPNYTGYYPGYTFGISLPDILNGLKATNNVIKIQMDVKVASESEYSISISGQTAFSIPFGDLFTVGVDGNANYFHDEIVTNKNSVSIEMIFSGVTLVNYSPNDYNESTGENWFYMAPVLDAIKNNNQDVSGYQFSPSPGIDFSDAGPFGILQGVAISNYPDIVITVVSENYQSIETTFKQTVAMDISFLGISLGGGSESTYSHSASSSISTSTVTITLSAPPDMVAGRNTDSVGWILGVQTNYPTLSIS